MFKVVSSTSREDVEKFLSRPTQVEFKDASTGVELVWGYFLYVQSQGSERQALVSRSVLMTDLNKEEFLERLFPLKGHILDAVRLRCVTIDRRAMLKLNGKYYRVDLRSVKLRGMD